MCLPSAATPREHRLALRPDILETVLETLTRSGMLEPVPVRAACPNMWGHPQWQCRKFGPLIKTRSPSCLGEQLLEPINKQLCLAFCPIPSRMGSLQMYSYLLESNHL